MRRGPRASASSTTARSTARISSSASVTDTMRAVRGRRRRCLGPGDGWSDPGPGAGRPHGGVGRVVTGAPHDDRRLARRVEHPAEELGHGRGRGRRQVPDDRPERPELLDQIRSTRGGAGEVGLAVEPAEVPGDAAEHLHRGRRRGAPGEGHALERVRADVAELRVQRGERGLRGLVRGDRGERTGVVDQGLAHRRTERGVGEGPRVEQQVRGEQLGQAERGEEGDVRDAAGTDQAGTEQPPGGQPGEVGGHDHRDGTEGPGLRVCDGRGERLCSPPARTPSPAPVRSHQPVPGRRDTLRCARAHPSDRHRTRRPTARGDAPLAGDAPSPGAGSLVPSTATRQGSGRWSAKHAASGYRRA
jgi:hypothetical protein